MWSPPAQLACAQFTRPVPRPRIRNRVTRSSIATRCFWPHPLTDRPVELILSREYVARRTFLHWIKGDSIMLESKHWRIGYILFRNKEFAHMMVVFTCPPVSDRPSPVACQRASRRSQRVRRADLTCTLASLWISR